MIKDIEEILNNGMVIDVFKTEKAFAVYNKIGEYANELNNSCFSTTNSFRYYQKLAFNEGILSLARLYDKKNNFYPNRCIDSLVKKIKSSLQDPPEIVGKAKVIDKIDAYGFDNPHCKFYIQKTKKSVNNSLIY